MAFGTTQPKKNHSISSTTRISDWRRDGEELLETMNEIILPTMAERKKWSENRPNFAEGDLSWRDVILTQTRHGQDGLSVE